MDILSINFIHQLYDLTRTSRSSCEKYKYRKTGSYVNGAAYQEIRLNRFLRLLHTMNVRFSLLDIAQRILGVTLPNFQ